MTFVKAGVQHDFEAKATGVTKGAPARFKISAYPAAGAKVLAEGEEKAQAGGVKHKWKTEGPPTDAANGARSWRVAYEVTVDVDRDGATTQLKAPSQEVDVFHDWVELTTVKEDGSAYPNAVFDVVVSAGGREIQRIKGKSTGKTGVLKVTGLKGGDVAVVFKAPHELVAWESGTGCKLKAKVRLVPKAALVWPKPDKKGQHVQWVNLAADSTRKEQGSVCKLTLKLEGGKAGDKVYVKTSYAAASVSPRSTHTRGIKSPDSPLPAWAGAAPNTGKKAAVAARNGGFEVDVEVECGIAGGDEITVAAGGTEACSEVKLTIITRRKIRYEVLVPKDTVSGVASKGASDAVKKAVSAALGTVGIGDEVDSTKTYDVADLPAANVVHDGAYFGKKAGTKLVVLTPDQYLGLKSKTSTGSATTGLVECVLWGDYIASNGPSSAQFSSVVGASFYGDATPYKWSWNASTTGLPYDPRNPGNPAVHSIRWCTAAYKEGGRWIEYSVDPDDGTPLGASGSSSPGGHKSAWQTVSPTAANVAKYCEFKDHKTLTVKCPSADANDPGKFLDDGGVKVGILIEVEVYYVMFGLLIGIAKDGVIGMTTGGGDFTASGLAEIILHETGHNLGVGLIDRTNGSQTVGTSTQNFGQSKSPPSGPITGLTFDEKGADGKATGTKLEWPQPVPDGLVYAGKGHLGPHCAHGLTRAQRSRAGYGGLSGKCLMFGASNPKVGAVRSFCPQCAVILRARDVSNVRRTWWV